LQCDAAHTTTASERASFSVKLVTPARTSGAGGFRTGFRAHAARPEGRTESGHGRSLQRNEANYLLGTASGRRWVSVEVDRQIDRAVAHWVRVPIIVITAIAWLLIGHPPLS